MKHCKVAVAIKDDREAEHVCSLIDQTGANCMRVEPVKLLDASSAECQGLAALVARIDDWSLEPVFFRSLEKALPELKVIVLSRSHRNPELKQAIRRNIFSCLFGPYDEELTFCLRSILRAAESA